MPGWFSPRETVPEVAPAEVHQRQAAGEGLFLLDVREHYEYAEAHVAGSTLIPLGDLAGRLDTLPKDQPIVVICRSGNRSGAATRLLRQRGFATVHNMRGGIIAWVRGGLPVHRGH